MLRLAIIIGQSARPAALAACSLPRRTIPHAVPRAFLTSRRAVRPTGRHVQSKFDLSTRRVLLSSHRGRPALPRGHARSAALAVYALPLRTTSADLHLLAGRPEEGRAATQRDPPRPTSALPTSRGHTRTCPARPPTPDLPHSPTSNSRTHHARRTGRPTAAARRARCGDLQAGGKLRAGAARASIDAEDSHGDAGAAGEGRARKEARRGRRSDGHGTGGRAQ